jgi:hypothetical protein
MDMWLVFYWTGPIGFGISLVCLGAMIFLLKNLMKSANLQGR